MTTPSANGPTKRPPVEPLTPRRRLYISTPTIAPARAPATLCESDGVALRSVLNDPANQAPGMAPAARAAK